MTDAQKQLTEEAAEIVARIAAAKDNPAELERLQRQYGERLAHLKARLPEPAPEAPEAPPPPPA